MEQSKVEQRGVNITGNNPGESESILSPETLECVVDRHREFNPQRKKLLQDREDRQKELDSGKLPDFLDETRAMREGDWTVGSIPDDLQDRRTEITGPVDRKMVINALNSGAKVFMADFEDAK